MTASEYISQNISGMEAVSPASSSWGNKGYSSTWIDESNSWIYKHLRRASNLMVQIAGTNSKPKGLLKRALNQALRELLLAQASDWPFMMKTGNSSEFAKNKFEEHINNFFSLHNQITTNRINKEGLLSLEKKNAIFPDIDYRIYADNKSG